jgi:hypothetical protein
LYSADSAAGRAAGMNDPSRRLAYKVMLVAGTSLEHSSRDGMGLLVSSPAKGVFRVRVLQPGMPAALCGRIAVGDALLSINGILLHRLELDAVMALLAKGHCFIELERPAPAASEGDDRAMAAAAAAAGGLMRAGDGEMALGTAAFELCGTAVAGFGAQPAVAAAVAAEVAAAVDVTANLTLAGGEAVGAQPEQPPAGSAGGGGGDGGGEGGGGDAPARRRRGSMFQDGNPLPTAGDTARHVLHLRSVDPGDEGRLVTRVCTGAQLAAESARAAAVPKLAPRFNPTTGEPLNEEAGALYERRLEAVAAPMLATEVSRVQEAEARAAAAAGAAASAVGVALEARSAAEATLRAVGAAAAALAALEEADADGPAFAALDANGDRALSLAELRPALSHAVAAAGDGDGDGGGGGGGGEPLAPAEVVAVARAHCGAEAASALELSEGSEGALAATEAAGAAEAALAAAAEAVEAAAEGSEARAEAELVAAAAAEEAARAAGAAEAARASGGLQWRQFKQLLHGLRCANAAGSVLSNADALLAANRAPRKLMRKKMAALQSTTTTPGASVPSTGGAPTDGGAHKPVAPRKMRKKTTQALAMLSCAGAE